jgi:hypothetical protein
MLDLMLVVDSEMEGQDGLHVITFTPSFMKICQFSEPLLVKHRHTHMYGGTLSVVFLVDRKNRLSEITFSA